MSKLFEYPDDLGLMLDETRYAQQFISGIGFDAFLLDVQLQRAVEQSLVWIGEGARYIPLGVRQKYPTVAWEELVKTGDRLVERYWDVDLAAVWETVREKLPRLQENIEGILSSIQPEG